MHTHEQSLAQMNKFAQILANTRKQAQVNALTHAQFISHKCIDLDIKKITHTHTHTHTHTQTKNIYKQRNRHRFILTGTSTCEHLDTLTKIHTRIR